MTTAADLINLALRDSGVLGVGQTAQTQQLNDMLKHLNMMLAQWNRRRWLVYHLVDTAVTCDGSQSYTVGGGQDFDIARPDRIEAAYIRQVVPANPTPVDWPLKLLQSYEDYSKITLKGLTAAPSSHLFYDSGYPTGRVYPWPVPNNQYELHLLTKAELQQFASTTTNVTLPPEYEDAITCCLINIARAAFRLPPDAFWIGKEKAALATLRKANFQIGQLGMPKGIKRGPTYNVYSDQGT